MKETKASKAIKQYRNEKHLTQEELAALSGINVSTIKKYECGERNPKPEQLLKIARALDISLTRLLDFELSTVDDIVTVLLKISDNFSMTWETMADKDGNTIPSGIKISFQDSEINEALAKAIDRMKQ